MSRLDPFRLRFLVAACIVGLLLACRSHPPGPEPFRPEQLEIVREYRLRDAAQVPDAASSFGSVRTRIVALEAWPDGFGEPVATRARLIGSSAEGEYLRPSQLLARDARVGRLDAGSMPPGSGRSELLTESVGVWAHGVETAFRVEARRAGSRKLLGVGVSLFPEPGGAMRVILELEGNASLVDAEEFASDEALEEVVSREVPVTETLHFVLTPTGADRFCFVVRHPPAEAENDPRRVPAAALALILQIDGEGPGGESFEDLAVHQAAVAACRAALDSPTPPAVVAAVPPGQRGLGLLVGVHSGERLRPRLAYLGRDSGARVAEDLALSMPAQELATLCASLPLDATVADEDLGRWLQVACLTAMARSVEAATATPAVEALLMQFTGELARNPMILIELLDRSTSLEDLQEQLVRANRLFLGDSTVTARLRAFDWLDRQGLRPEGFDPLASREVRRDALRALEASWAMGSAEGGP